MPDGSVTVIVGANACGKSTLLRGLARLLRPRGGTVLLEGEDIHRLPTRAVASRPGLLPQQPIAPEGITVADLVSRGRHPHQRWFRQWSATDAAAVEAALAATGTTGLADRSVDELSGGQRQRVWIALALVAMKDGAIVAEGPPDDVIAAGSVAEVFGLACRVVADPVTGTPLVLSLPAGYGGEAAGLHPDRRQWRTSQVCHCLQSAHTEPIASGAEPAGLRASPARTPPS